jgi:hypothetical protein
MNGNSQTRCPYTLKRLDDLIKINEEHVFPEAIGGPQSFHVKADEGSNTTFGHTTDARFVNSKFIELWRAIFGIKGRLGREPRAEFRGEVKDTEEDVKVKIRQGAPIVEYDPLVKIRHRRGLSFVTPKNPKFDSETMTGKLTAPQDQAEKELSTLEWRERRARIVFHSSNGCRAKGSAFPILGGAIFDKRRRLS